MNTGLTNKPLLSRLEDLGLLSFSAERGVVAAGIKKS
jgi:hypothetical protein